MSTMIKAGALVTILGVIMGLTNPKMEAYQQYAAGKLLDKGEKVFCQQTQTCNQDSTPVLLKDTLNTVKGKIVQPTLAKAISRTTERQNLLFLSLYTTDIPGKGKMKTIGAFGQFFTYAKQ